MIEYVKDSFSEYLSKKDHVSASDIKNFLKSPRYYYFKKYEEEDKEDKRHFLVGSAQHCLILEPEEFDLRYCALLRKLDMRTKEGKDQYKEFTEANVGKAVLTLDEWTTISELATGALKNETFKELITDCHTELSIYTIDEATGLKIKLRPDAYSKSKAIITDLKTTTDASPDKFKWSVKDYGYDISAAFYLDYSGKEYYVFAALEKSPPFQCCLYQLSEDALARGRKKYRMGLDLIAFCYKNRYWPAADEFQILKEFYSQEFKTEEYFEYLKTRTKIITIN